MEMLAFFLSTFDCKSSPLILYMLHTYTSALVIYWYEQLNIVIQLEACLFYLITINTSTPSQCTQLNYVINVFLNPDFSITSLFHLVRRITLVCVYSGS